MIRGLKSGLSSSAVSVVLAFAYPAALLFSENRSLYQRSQVGAVSLVLLLLAVAAAFAVRLVARTIERLTKRRPMQVPDAAQLREAPGIGAAVEAGMAGTILLAMLSWPIQALPYGRLVMLAGCGLLVALIAMMGYFTRGLVLNLTLGSLVVFNGAVAVRRSSGAVGSKCGWLHPATDDVIFRTRPDVDFVLLESYNSFDVRRDIYGIDNAGLTQALRHDGFTMYDSVYSNYFSTLPSLSSAMLMTHHFYDGTEDLGLYQKVIGGALENPVLRTFAANGYSIDYGGFGHYLFSPSDMLAVVPAKALLQPLELFPALLWLPRRVRSVLGGNTRTSGADERPQPASTIWTRGRGGWRSSAATRPVFAMIYAGAAHAPIYISGYPDSMESLRGFRRLDTWQANLINGYWVSEYRRLVASSDRLLIALADSLTAEDSGAVVILLGDHGARLHWGQWNGASMDPNRNMVANGTKPLDVTRDLFQVFLAVRWPSASPRRIISPVNLFGEVFAFLAGDSTAPHRAPDDSYARISTPGHRAAARVFQTVRNGRPLQRWEQVDGRPLNASCR